jgi:hypothetical protein
MIMLLVEKAYKNEEQYLGYNRWFWVFQIENLFGIINCVLFWLAEQIVSDWNE